MIQPSGNVLISIITAPLSYWSDWCARKPHFLFWLRALIITIFIFLLLSILISQPHIFVEANWSILASILIVGVPASIFVRAYQFLLIARLLHVPHTLSTSWNVVMAVSIANLLPFPAGIAIRIAALKTEKSRYHRIASLNLLISGLSLAIASIAIGGALFDLPSWSVPLIGFGTLFFFLSVVGLFMHHVSWRITIYLVLLQVMGFTIDLVRIFICATAFGFSPQIDQVVVLSVANVIASLAAVAPGGFGIREVTAITLAHLVDLNSSLAFVFSSTNGIIGAIFLLIYLGVNTLAISLRSLNSRFRIDRHEN